MQDPSALEKASWDPGSNEHHHLFFLTLATLMGKVIHAGLHGRYETLIRLVATLMQYDDASDKIGIGVMMPSFVSQSILEKDKGRPGKWKKESKTP